MIVKESEVAQLCPILCNLKDCSLPDSPDHWISQARTVEWVAMSFSKESSQSIDQVCIFCISGRCFINSSAVKHLPAMQEETMNNEGDVGLIPGSGRSPGERNGKPLQYSCLGNPMDREARETTVLESQSLGHDWVTDTHTHAPGYPYILMEKESSIFLSTYWSSSPHPAWQSNLWFVYFGARTCCLRVCSQTSTLI